MTPHNVFDDVRRAIVALALSKGRASDALIPLACGNEALEAILRLVHFELTGKRRNQLRWLILKSVVKSSLDGTKKAQRAQVQIEDYEHPSDLPPAAMTEAWMGKARLSGLAHAIVSLMSEVEKRELSARVRAKTPAF